MNQSPPETKVTANRTRKKEQNDETFSGRLKKNKLAAVCFYC